MSHSVSISRPTSSDIEAIDFDNVQCYLAAFQRALDVYLAATLESESWGAARCRAILTDMRRCLCRELKKVNLSKSTFLVLGLDLLVETLWDTLSFPPGESKAVDQLVVRIKKASCILVTLSQLVDALVSTELLYPAFDDER